MKKYINLKPYGSSQKIRKRFYTQQSIAHPAKMDIPLCRWILDHYIKDGDIVLDPMAGIGSTLIEGMRMFPNSIFVGVEFEEKFVKMCQTNIRLVKKIAKEDMFMKIGQAICIQGDSRSLEGMADKIISSPPFGGSEQFHDLEFIHKEQPRPNRPTQKQDCIGGLKDYGKIDKIISSPPYEGSISGKDEQARERELRYLESVGRSTSLGNIITQPNQYSSNKDNIGNIKGKTYLGEMLKIYRECWKVLVPEGLLCLVVKCFIRNKKVVELPLDTIKLAEKAGFTHIKTHYRKIENPSFWRTLHRQKYPLVDEEGRTNEEDVLVFKKGRLL